MQRAKGGLWRKAALYLGGIVLTTLVAAAATGPFAVFHFNRFAVYQLIANFAAVPLTAVWVMPWATLVYFLMPLGLEDWTLTPMSWGVDALIWLARTVTAWPHAVTLLPSMPSAALALIAFGGLWLCLWRRTWRFAGLLPIAIGCASMVTVGPPDVLVATEGGLFAVRDSAGQLVFSSARGGQTFLPEVWQRRAGAGSRATDNGDNLLRCDGLGCLYHSRGKTVAFIRDAAALAEDCAVADVVVSWMPIRSGRCEGPVLLDRKALAAGGGHAIWLEADSPPRVETVRESRGARPWSGIR